MPDAPWHLRQIEVQVPRPLALAFRKPLLLGIGQE
jgi:hypothetical protein